MVKAACWMSLGWFALALSAGCSDDGKTNSSGESVASCDCPVDWALDNSALCVSPRTSYSPPLIFSSHLDEAGKVVCDPGLRFPQPLSKLPWSAQEMSSRCVGKGTLTLRVRTGKAKSASADDCVLVERAFDFEYTEANRTMTLADIDAWSAQDEACSRAFENEGGYFEFRVDSDTLGCGMPGEKVNYVDICLATCEGDPSRPGCEACGDTPERNRI
jgi:hypothetical protein